MSYFINIVRFCIYERKEKIPPFYISVQFKYLFHYHAALFFSSYMYIFHALYFQTKLRIKNVL